MKFKLSGFSRISQDSNVLNGRSLDANSRFAAQNAFLEIRWDAEAKLGSLLGEPVISLHFKYDVVGGAVTLPKMTSRGIQYELRSYKLLTDDLRSKLRISDVDLRMTFSAKNVASEYALLDMVEDAGATGAPGEWSYNVPGSPDWDETFLIVGSEDRFIPETIAKLAWKNGLSLNDAIIEKARLNFHYLHSYYMKRYRSREKYRSLENAYNQLAEGLRRSYGIDVKNIAAKDAWNQSNFALEAQREFDDPSVWEGRVAELEKHLKKLAAFPDNLRLGNNHVPYNAAVNDYKRLTASINLEFSNFEPEGKDPQKVKRGFAAKFGGDSRNVSQDASGIGEKRPGDVRVWTIYSYIDKKGKGPKVGSEIKLGYNLYRKGKILDIYQITRKKSGCTAYTTQFIRFMTGYMKEADIERYSKNTDIYLSRADADKRVKDFKSNPSYPAVNIITPKKNPCSDEYDNAPRP
ncbi:MAG: hypothetical protein AAGF54_10570 [Pseudomonadota bacterium]